MIKQKLNFRWYTLILICVLVLTAPMSVMATEANEEVLQEEPVEWLAADFSYNPENAAEITGLSTTGEEKRAKTNRLVIPDKNESGGDITRIADVDNMKKPNGAFATDTARFEYVSLPAKIEYIGANAFRETGIKEEVVFPNTVKEIGACAFQMNELPKVILPDPVGEADPALIIGGGAFATNPTLTMIKLPKGIKDIPAGAFGCSDKKNYMTGLTELTIPEGVETIGNNAFSGNNITNLVIPSTVKSIGKYAFSTKNYLNGECTLYLPEGLVAIGDYAFRNKVIREVVLPGTVTALPKNVFLKEYSDGTEPLVTTVVVNEKQFKDKVNFPDSQTHKLKLAVPGEQPKPKNGWQKEEGKYYYYENGKKVTGWKNLGGKWYYLNSDGAMATGWKKLGGKWYYLNPNGDMATGWQKIGASWYYLNSSGVMVTGWKKTGAGWYYLNGSGAMVTGWKKINSRWYFFNANGTMATGWKQIAGRWYWFNSGGVWVK